MELNSVIKRYWSVILCSVLIEVIVALRVVWSLRSGFILPDEAVYFGSYYPSRWLFHSILDGMLCLFNVHNVWQFMTIMPFVNSMFLIACLFVLYKISNSHWIVISMFLTLTFLINIPFVLTESLALLMILVGIYGTVRMWKERKFAWGIVSAICFVLASLLREPYMVFAFGNAFLVMFLMIKQKKIQVAGILFVLIAFGGALFFSPKLNFKLFEKIKVGNTSHGLYPFPENMQTTFLQRMILTFSNFPIGILFGWNVILGILAIVGTLMMIKQRNDLIILANVLFGFLTFLGTSNVLAQYSFYMTPLALSSMVRLSHTTLPSVLSLKTVYRKVNPRKAIAVTLILDMLCFPVLAYVVQSNLSVNYINRIDWNYKAPWLRLSQLVKNSCDVLIFAEPLIRAKIFTESENVLVLLPLNNETEFYEMINQGWDKIYFYGEIHTLHFNALKCNCFYYYEIVTKRQNVTVIWDDAESYLLEWKG